MQRSSVLRVFTFEKGVQQLYVNHVSRPCEETLKAELVKTALPS